VVETVGVGSDDLTRRVDAICVGVYGRRIIERDVRASGVKKAVPMVHRDVRFQSHDVVIADDLARIIDAVWIGS
jgi:hypothetical protein